MTWGLWRRDLGIELSMMLLPKFVSLLKDGRWCFPRTVSYELVLVSQSLAQFNANNNDSAYWTLHGSGQYTSASAKEALREHRSNVMWYKLVRSKGHVPKQAFILWMVCKGKLLTKAKLRNWGYVI